MYEARYGRSLVRRVRPPWQTRILNMTHEELKRELLSSPRCGAVAAAMYPGFPKGLGRMEAVMLLFDMAGRDGRTDELRRCLIDVSAAYRKDTEEQPQP